MLAFNQETPAESLIEIADHLAGASTMETISAIITRAVRNLLGADGATFVLRDEDKCYYFDEDAISPLWKGKRFPVTACVSGLAMTQSETIVIQDIYADPRVPHDAYRPTFVKSMCMVPVRERDPIAAIGAYWARPFKPSPDQLRVLQVLANSAAFTIENHELKELVRKRNSQKEQFESRQTGLEAAFYTLAHDLRTPLAAITLFAENIRDFAGSALPEKADRCVGSIVKSSLRMSENLGRMLTLYRATNRELSVQPVDLSEMVTSVMTELHPSPVLNVKIQPGLQAQADPALLRLALENLLSNALKFTAKKENGEIEFGCSSRSAGESVFFIRDNGAGFDSAQAAKLFQPLVRLHTDNQFPGTGLGLASVARIIELHNGSVSAVGEKGKGATFSFSLPVVPS